jgi:Skp family chaperone for outer membrane proteins
MKLKTLLPIAALAIVAGAVVPSLLSAQAAGAGGGAMRIAVADASRIFNEMQERKDIQVSMQSELERLNAQNKERTDELRKLQAQRDQLKPDTPQYDDLNEKLNDGAIEFRSWQAQATAKAERSQKRQVKALFQRVEAAVAEIATQQGYDLVLTKQRPELPDNLDAVKYEQIVAALSARNVLYASPKADISDAVIAALDAKYKARGGAASAAPAPAPEKAPAPAAPAPAPAGPRRNPAPAPR